MDKTGRYVRTVVPPPDTPPNPSRGAAPGAADATPALVSGAVQGFAVPGVNLNPARREVAAGMPAGDYFAIALDDLDLESLRDPEVLAQLARGATRVTLADSGPAEVNLRRITLARPR
jgi:hypothetical protein